MGCVEGAVQKYYLVGSGWPGGGDLAAGLHRPISSRGGGDVGRTGLRSLQGRSIDAPSGGVEERNIPKKLNLAS